MTNWIERLNRQIEGCQDGVPGFLGWLMVKVRRRLLLAGAFLFIAPTLLGVFLWRAATLEKEYTAEVPIVVSDFSHDPGSVEALLNSEFPILVRATLAEPEAFLLNHRWESEEGGGSSIRNRFVSIVTTDDVRLATETHRRLVADFAAWANDRHPGVRFAAGDEITAANSLLVDDSAIRENTRLSLVFGASAYAMGLTLLVTSIGQIGWKFG